MFEYEIREIDAMPECDNLWYWNSSYKIGTFKTNANDHKRAFLNALKKLNITCKRGMCYIAFDGDIYELRERKTDMPLIAAIPMF